MKAEGHAVSQSALRENIAGKIKDETFLSDVPTLLRPGISYDPNEAFHFIDTELLSHLGI